MKRIAMTTMLATFLAAALSALGGCGGSGSGSGSSGTDRSKQVTAVTEADKGSLCDWFVGMVGGYGAVSTCAEAFLQAPPDKADCTATFPQCAVTIGQFEDCISTIVDAQETCTEAALTAAQMTVACQAVGTAGCFN